MTPTFAVVVKRDCPTCVLIAPALVELAAAVHLSVYSQDDLAFPPDIAAVIDDSELSFSWRHDIETVPTLLRLTGGGDDWADADRTEGWLRDTWREFTGVDSLGEGLPDYRPGCGSLSVDPSRVDALRVRHDGSVLTSRRVELSSTVDETEACYDRGWTDGLPVVPPTAERVMRMLDGTTRAADEIVAVVPPDLVECTVEKVAINAVMAGCRPEYLPVVLTAVETACTDRFNMHGLLATTWFSSPMIVVSGPIARRIGMNSGVNALGQGNRANATIGRALQLVVRNVGGGRPGGVDRATLGNPGKYTFCFSETDVDPALGWPTQAAEHGVDPTASAVTLFAAEGVRGFVDQISREPESLARHLAAALRTVASPKLAIAFDAAIVLCPEHLRVFTDAGWTKARLREELASLLMIDGAELARGYGGIDEGMPAGFETMNLPKFRDGGLLIFHAGGAAGMFSAVIGGWASGSMGSEPVSAAVR